MWHEYKGVIAIALLIYTLLVSYIGLRSRKSRTSEDYFLASRSLPAWLLSITFVASWWGGGSAIDLVDQANREGLSTFWIYGVPVLLATGLMYLFAGGIRRIAAISQSELMERRYDGRSSLMLTIFIFIFMTIGAAVQVIVVGAFFQSFFEISYEMGCCMGTLLVVIYSLFGGFRGVVLTDLLQFIFFLASSLFLFWISWVTFSQAGGIAAFSERVESIRELGFTNFMSNLDDNIAYVITFGTSWMVQANVWQRISAARTPEDARKMMATSFIIFIPLYLVVTLTGMLSIMSYSEVPEGGIVSAILLSLDSPIVGGIIFVGLCSAIMSTMDSMLNTGAMTLTVDLYQRYLKPQSTNSQMVLVGRLSTFIIAAIALFIGVKIRSVLVISWIGADFIATGAFIPLVLGFIWRRGTSSGAFAAMLFGLIFSLYNLIVAMGVELPVAWEIASARQAIVGIILSTIIYCGVSLLSKPNYEKADKFIKTTDVL